MAAVLTMSNSDDVTEETVPSPSFTGFACAGSEGRFDLGPAGPAGVVLPDSEMRWSKRDRQLARHFLLPCIDALNGFEDLRCRCLV